MCSRVCHDLINPVGAIVNGLEVFDSSNKEDDKEFALDLIRKSAKSTSARLQFCRIAYGAAGSAGSQIDLGEAQKMTRNHLEDEKTKITESAARPDGEEPRQAVAEYVRDRTAGHSARRRTDR
jgi:histidine phosphotransferase ChpT